MYQLPINIYPIIPGRYNNTSLIILYISFKMKYLLNSYIYGSNIYRELFIHSLNSLDFNIINK